MQDDLLTKTGMELVLHGGDARELIRKAMKSICAYDIKGARLLLEKANEELIAGHKAQTKVLEIECSDEPLGYNILFVHGMDTLMTVKSEYEIALMMIDMFEALYEKK